MVNAMMLDRWVLAAKPGEMLEYHRGHLAVDRQKAASRAISKTAACAWRYYEKGEITLFQKRLGPEAGQKYATFIYLAVRLKPQRRKDRT